MEIELTERDHKGRYTARIPGIDAVAELTYSRMSDVAVIADHTDVPQALRGTGVGTALIERLVADARKLGFQIVPLCPFVRAQYARHPEWADVMQA